MTRLGWVAAIAAGWAAAVFMIILFVHACSVGRRRVEGGRPEDMED